MKLSSSPKSKRLIVIRNERGQSIIQVLIASAAMGFLFLVMASMQAMQAREQRALMEKMSSIDVMRVMTLTVSNQTACSTIIAPGNLVTPSQLPVTAAAATNISATNPYVIKLKEIPNANILPGTAPSPMSETLKLASSTASQSGLQIVFTSPTTAALQVNFDQTQLVRPIKNLSFPLVTSVVAGSTTISGCKASAGVACPSGQTMTGINPDGSPLCVAAAGGSCPAGQTMTGINPNGTPQCAAAAAGGAGVCPSGQLMIGINANGSPLCTTQGSQAGAPCTVAGGPSGTDVYSGVTVIYTDNNVGSPTQGTYRCCHSIHGTYGSVCPAF